jgi:hypothetical protein
MGRPRKYERTDPENLNLESAPANPEMLVDDPIVPALAKTHIEDEFLVPPDIKHITNKLSDPKQIEFLQAYVVLGNRSRALRAVQISAAHLHAWKQQPAFAKAYALAHEIAVDMAEDELLRRATEGVLEPVFQGGRLVGGVRKYSDNLLITYLKAQRAAYKDKTDVTVTHDVADRLIKARERVFGRITDGEESK